ncbi:hypothetical protein J751_2300 [Acinetobacter baumannii 24812_8]|nr:hypothetical protein A1S_3481 [Acinetobacter baumannii ATCC 17978]EXG51032.1 hypothetical protein J735_1744 [Acinetobacter baumannii 24860_2]KCY53510.1 hypothetical protein J751_2300 [Acinetobacter baumannii 24812_8]
MQQLPNIYLFHHYKYIQDSNSYDYSKYPKTVVTLSRK